MLSALQLLRAKVKSGLEMSKLVSVMRNMPQVMVNVIVENASKNKFNEYKEVAEAITDAELRLGEKGRVLVRASGTEPLIRIMLEGENKGEINALALNIAEKMVNGRIKKFYKEVCLLDQPFIKDGDITVSQYVENTAKALGGKIAVVNFVRFEKGEGLEKRNDNFADEVANMVK